MNDCIFCKIVAGDIPAYKVYEDEMCLAFLDIHPVSPGHTLLVPKQHFEWMQDTPDDVLTYCIIKSKMLMSQMKEKLGADYIQVSVVGKDIPHFHIHLMPRMPDDNLIGWQTQNSDKKDFEKVLEKLTT